MPAVRRSPLPHLVAILALTLALAAPLASAAEASPERSVWIVSLDEGHPSSVHANAMARHHGGEARHIYSNVLNGFSFVGTERAAANLARDPRVSSVVADQPVSISGHETPTGVQRIDADPGAHAAGHVGEGAVIAILDTGIETDHPALSANIHPDLGRNCMSSDTGAWEDGHGHGTHVAGTAAAAVLDGGFTGVAPAAQLVPVKVLGDDGGGSWSTVICGIDYVTANAATIDVANMSLGGSGEATGCDDGGLHEAICGSVAAGVVYTVAAGNSSTDARNAVPAAYPEVITVSALADFDGEPGGDGGCVTFWVGPSPFHTTTQCDDEFAFFSNYGPAIDVIAPGVLIYSADLNGSYSEKSGTSMAAPHVAGVAALALAANPNLGPDDVRALLRTTGECPDGHENPGDEDCEGQEWPEDPDGTAEPLVNAHRAAAAAADFEGGDDGGETGPVGPTADFTYTCEELSCTFTDTSTDGDANITSWAWDFGDDTTSTDQHPTHTYGEAGDYTVTLTVTDENDLSDATSLSVTVAADQSDDPDEPAAIELSVTTYKVRGLTKADLSWSGTDAVQVDILRDGAVIATVDDNGTHTDHLDSRGSPTHTYQVCEAGTDTCSGEITATW